MNWLRGMKTKVSELMAPPLIPILISSLALVVSFFTYWDSVWHSSVAVSVGRQARLYVVVDSNGAQPQPAIFLSLDGVNSGGKAKVISDFRLRAAIVQSDSSFFTFILFAGREVKNFLEAEGAYEQFPISPFVVMGKSQTARQYAFWTPTRPEAFNVPDAFLVSFRLDAMIDGKWHEQVSYISDKVSGVWRDLDTGPPYNSFVVDLHAL